MKSGKPLALLVAKSAYGLWAALLFSFTLHEIQQVWQHHHMQTPEGQQIAQLSVLGMLVPGFLTLVSCANGWALKASAKSSKSWIAIILLVLLNLAGAAVAGVLIQIEHSLVH